MNNDLSTNWDGLFNSQKDTPDWANRFRDRYQYLFKINPDMEFRDGIAYGEHCKGDVLPKPDNDQYRKFRIRVEVPGLEDAKEGDDETVGGKKFITITRDNTPGKNLLIVTATRTRIDDLYRPELGDGVHTVEASFIRRFEVTNTFMKEENDISRIMKGSTIKNGIFEFYLGRQVQ